MKKRFLIPFLIVAPLLTSCKGTIISTDTARSILKNIDNVLNGDEHPYLRFTYKYSVKNGEATQFVKVTFDNFGQFYNKYVITYDQNEEGVYEYHTNEYWSYVKDNKYYDLIRVDGTHNETEAIVKYVDGDAPKEYKDEYWIDKSAKVISEIEGSYLYFSLRNVSSLVEYKDVVNRANVTLSSMNDTSICAEGEVDMVKFKYQIDDAYITSFTFEVDENHRREFFCNYKRAQITYLNL